MNPQKHSLDSVKRKGRKPGSYPLYRQIADKIKIRIDNKEWPSGERLPSARLLAIEYSVGRQVVQMAINELVLNCAVRIDKQRFPVVKQVRGPLAAKQRTVAIVVSSQWTADVIAPIIRGLNYQLSNQMTENYAILLQTLPSFQSVMPPHLESFSLEGIFLIGQFTKEVLCQYTQLKTPVIMIDFPSPNWTGLLIGVENINAIADATSRLIKVGHRRIAFLRYLNKTVGVIDPDSAERQLGFEKAFQMKNINLDYRYIFSFLGTSKGDLTTINTILDEKPRFTAIVTCDDTYAKKMINAANKRGMQIPRDLSVVSLTSTQSTSPISGPMCDFFKMGIEAAKMIESKQKRVRIPCTWNDGTTFGATPSLP